MISPPAGTPKLALVVTVGLPQPPNPPPKLVGREPPAADDQDAVADTVAVASSALESRRDDGREPPCPRPPNHPSPRTSCAGSKLAHARRVELAQCITKDRLPKNEPTPSVSETYGSV